MQTFFTPINKPANNVNFFGTTYKSFKDKVLNDTIFTKFPYMKGEKKINLNLIANTNPVFVLNQIKDPTYKVNLAFNPYNLFAKNVAKMQEILYYTANPTYDFKIGNTPVKIGDKYIQIGYAYIPTYATADYFNKLNTEDLEKVLEVLQLIDEYEKVEELFGFLAAA